MARGSKDYDKRTHAASKKDTKGRQKEVWDMIGAKKKLHEMVEALINSDSKAAAAALHDYLQVKTRAILGEEDHEEGDEMVADRHEEDGEDHEGDEHDDGEECPECGMSPCECEHDEDGEDHEGDEHDDADDFGDDAGGDEHEEHMFGEGVRGKAVANDASVRTRMRKSSEGSKDLHGKVKGDVKFNKKGKAKLTHPHNNAAPHLDRKVKGTVKF